MRMPQTVAQYRDSPAARPVLIREETATQRRRHAEHTEEIGRGMDRFHALRPVASAQVQARAFEVVSGHGLKQLIVPCVEKLRDRLRVTRAIRKSPAHLHHAIRIW